MPSPSCLPIAILFAILAMAMMIVIPPVISGIKVDMPKLNTEPVEIYDDFKYVNVSVFPDGSIFVNGNNCRISDIGAVIKILYKQLSQDEIKVFVHASKDISYNLLVSVLQSLNNDGYKDITLVGGYSQTKSTMS